MARNIKKVFIMTLGIIFLVLGLVGLVLPFLQGIIFLIIGLMLVSICFPPVRALLKKHTERHHKVSSAIQKIEIWLEKFIGKI